MGQVLTIPEASSDLLIYGDKRNLITNNLYHQLQNMPKALTDFGTRLYNNMMDSYNYLTDTFLQSNIMQQLINNNVLITNNYIEQYLSFEQMRTANITMQRYIMANPTIRQLYVDQNCSGYPDTYVNIFDKNVGKDHYDYRRVTDGMLLSTNDGWEVTFYDEQLEIGDKELDFADKARIMTTWEAMDWLYDTCKFDFTNPDSKTKFGK